MLSSLLRRGQQIHNRFVERLMFHASCAKLIFTNPYSTPDAEAAFSAPEVSQPRPQGLLAFQYGGGSGEGPGT